MAASSLFFVVGQNITNRLSSTTSHIVNAPREVTIKKAVDLDNTPVL